MPSEALGRATTFDLYVLDTSARWFRYRQDLADGKITPKISAKDNLQRYMDLARTEDSERKAKLSKQTKE